MFLTSFGVLLDFTPKLLDREVIKLFETGGVKTPEGRQWGYLMCFGATTLRVCGFALSNYTEYVHSFELPLLQTESFTTRLAKKLPGKLSLARSSENQTGANALRQASSNL